MCTRAASCRIIRMTTITAWVIVALCSSIVEAKSNTLIEINPKRETIVKIGASLQILCSAQEPLRVCRVEIPGEGSIVLREEPSTDNINYFGEGFSKGQCGVTISSVKESHHGIFRCSLTTDSARQEATTSLNIIVAKPPQNVQIVTNAGNYGTERYRKGETLEISCMALGGRPASNVSLFLDDEPIGEERNNFYDTKFGDSYSSMQNASRSLDWTDNGKMIRCIVNHFALDHPKEIVRKLEVWYPPQPHATFERFGYVIGRQGIINITIYANPRPGFTWRVNNEAIDAGRPDESNRLETSTPVDLGNGAWSVILTIDSVQKSDTEKEYVLEASNQEGSSRYQIVLSTSSEPAGVDLDAGSIIGIVVGVLVLVLIIFLVIFARATGRWCFAARRRGDEETAGDVGTGSEAHITPGDEDDEDQEDPRIIDEKVPQGGQENPIHTSTEYVNGRTDIKDIKNEKTDTPV